ncbi:O-antigen ligase family protein [Paenibacillus typhae]|uniref:O-antigen ligase family protein n=1 Tax=Paenibacillus typhae TaxID=1174501 RepID=UPI001C8D44E7|nr:O-antigen ligase family protein [Paenibacillus typhae]MBY0013173.1 O-antigen ligase family protein [Paenibacillus typhae]
MSKNRRRLQFITAWGSTGMLLLAAAAACLLHGLFFARDMYGLLAVWFSLCAAAAVFLSLNGNPAEGGESIAERTEARSGYMGNLIRPDPGSRSCLLIMFLSCPLLILALYAIHLLHGPLSVQGTLNELLRWGLYGSFAFFSAVCAGSRGGARFLAALWHTLGMVLCLSGLLAACGLPLRYAIAYTDSPAVSATGARLGGLLQYPNAFGAVMAVFLLERAMAAAEAAARGSLRAQDTARQLLCMLPLFPYAAALLLSESRGALLAAACAAAAALLRKRQLAAPLLVCAAAPAAAAALLCRQLARTGLAAEPLPGLLLLAGCWAGALLAGLWLCRRCRGAAGWPFAAILLAAGLWTAAGSAVLALLRGRISGPSPTAAARGLFYRDAWRLAGEAPWLGQGGETWRSAYHAVQSRPYVGSQVHSGYLDILLNLGIAGSAAVLLMLLAAGILAGRNAPGLLPPLLVILLHGAVDFSWSYGLFWLLLFLLTARALAESHQHRLTGPRRDTEMNRRASAQQAGTRVLRIAVVCFCLILSGLSFKLWKGERLFSQAARSAEPAVQSMLLKKALHHNPYDPRIAVSFAGMLPEEEKEEMLLRSLEYSPGDAGLHWMLAEACLKGNEPGAALYWVRKSIELDRFNAFKWRRAAEGMLQMGRRSLAKGDLQRAAASAVAGQELVRGYRLLALQEHNKGPEHNDRSFEFSGETEEVGAELNQLIAAAYNMQPAKTTANSL